MTEVMVPIGQGQSGLTKHKGQSWNSTIQFPLLSEKLPMARTVTEEWKPACQCVPFTMLAGQFSKSKQLDALVL